MRKRFLLAVVLGSEYDFIHLYKRLTLLTKKTTAMFCILYLTRHERIPDTPEHAREEGRQPTARGYCHEEPGRHQGSATI